MAISTRDFTENLCIDFNGEIYTITECFHLSPIKGPSMVRTKLRDIKTGETISNAFNAAADVRYVEVEKVSARYRESGEQSHIFEALDSSKTVVLSQSFITSATEWMQVGDEIALVYIDGTLEGIEPLVNRQA